ncbi:MAG: Uma2 family endonuclease [Epsilonproteobacteria bacterium]|nr:Uma2 family endonuclease [Campylobacterota bacterium]
MEAIEYYTYEDYKMWEGDWELIDGFPLAMAPSPSKNHQLVASAIIANIYYQLEKSNCNRCEVIGEIDYKVCEDTILKPDVVLSCNDEGEDYLTKAPEVVFEVISKSTAKRDEKFKFKIYEREKVKYYVLLYPNDLKAKIYKLANNTYIKEGDFSNEKYFFKDISCPFTLDFKEIFKRVKR